MHAKESILGRAALKDSKPEFRIAQSGKTWDLSKINFDKLKEDFKTASHKNIEFATRLQGIIDRYNAGSSSADNYFDELVKFTKDMQAESERHILEGLTEEELELFDPIKKEKMTKSETQKVRLAEKSLLHRLREEPPKVLVQDWHKDSQTKLQVKSAVVEVLHSHLPGTYNRVLFNQKCDNVFASMVDYATQGLNWVASQCGWGFEINRLVDIPYEPTNDGIAIVEGRACASAIDLKSLATKVRESARMPEIEPLILTTAGNHRREARIEYKLKIKRPDVG